MFNLEKTIQNWKQELRKNPAFEDGDIAELESHLRDKIDKLKSEGLTDKPAFQKAIDTIGEPGQLGQELYKTRARRPHKRPSWQQKTTLSTLLPNYLKIAFRFAKRNKGHVSMNVMGLAIGLACCIFILLYVQNEISYDRFLENGDDIHRVIAERGNGDTISQTANTSYPIGPFLKDDFPEIARFVLP